MGRCSRNEMKPMKEKKAEETGGGMLGIEGSNCCKVTRKFNKLANQNGNRWSSGWTAGYYWLVVGWLGYR